ncbi:MAG: pilus (MSHA type) biogenesis protein MshL [Desulfofustis sp.]|nr:pilus (MSHA type) biogenesis protein MshL [Desulfofustis sp.]
MMKATKRRMHYLAILLLILFATSCTNQQQPVVEEPIVPDQQTIQAKNPIEKPPESLPIMYQSPAYMVDTEDDQDMILTEEETAVKVGATIKSTRGPQPLWDILKRLAALKKMNVSWASDVDQNVLVDVDINANDDFYQAVDNLLRQVDYFHEMQGNTIVVKYKETRQFRIAMPFIRQNYRTGTGGNVLGGEGVDSNVDGTVELKSDQNTFDIWESVQANMDKIINLWSTTAVTPEVAAAQEGAQADEPVQQATRRVSSGGVQYFIDKPVGIVTVVAPRPLLDRLQEYFDSLTSELYKQISIEAKIIEVHLMDNSSIGINWNQVLKNFNVQGLVTFGDPATGDGGGGQVWPYIHSNNTSYDDGETHGPVYDPTRFISKVSLQAAPFSVFLNALKTQGDTQVLSNPKLSVMNGQPALISVGENVTYIESIEVDRDTGGINTLLTYTVETARVLSGISLALTANILNDKEVIMNLVPITSELEEPIEYKQVGLEGTEVGLPRVRVREMSTTVRVKDNEMLVIGGLISEVNDTEGNFAPLVGKIPVIRYLFGYEEKVRQKRELIIILRPRII